MRERKQMVFDRTLGPEVFEVAYRIASGGHPFKRQRQLLMVALRDHVTEQEAGNKTKKLLTRVWINPPEPAAPLVAWAVDHPEAFPDRRIMHLGTLLATFPFVAAVAKILGRSFAIEGSVDGPELRRRMTGNWGARTMVELGATKTAGTFRKFDIISGGGSKRPYLPARRINVDGPAATWLAHALLVARDQQAIEVHDASTAPELFWADLTGTVNRYPHLERHSEGINRQVWVRC